MKMKGPRKKENDCVIVALSRLGMRAKKLKNTEQIGLG
jgi:hypothetical protein